MPERRFEGESWCLWLLGAAAVTVVTGVGFVVAPEPLLAMLAPLSLAPPVPAMSAEAAAYVAFVYGVLGAVMIGWGGTMGWLARVPLRRGEAWAWWATAVPLLAWFVPDTARSLLAGAWQNALLNVVFLIMFAPPLVGLFPGRRSVAAARSLGAQVRLDPPDP